MAASRQISPSSDKPGFFCEIGMGGDQGARKGNPKKHAHI